ncbi:DUF5615 family PIN-like protein [Candidatus Binatus sp.]|uniref:DUF5615 family PIN-like protein n=1 Tax=Candidatus Binatus sp. TaxID=2811406 RepID=UPI00351D68EA
MRPYRFLFDECVRDAAEYFPKARVISRANIKLKDGASDEAVVEAAYKAEAIIVTANGKDFIRIMDRFLKKQMVKFCRDLNGLVVIPNPIQQHVLRRAAERMTFDGEKITWYDVWRRDLYVKISPQGIPRVVRFRRCYYCEKHEST